jgi:hypothetical protein
MVGAVYCQPTVFQRLEGKAFYLWGSLPTLDMSSEDYIVKIFFWVYILFFLPNKHKWHFYLRIRHIYLQKEGDIKCYDIPTMSTYHFLLSYVLRLHIQQIFWNCINHIILGLSYWIKRSYKAYFSSSVYLGQVYLCFF